MNRAKRDDDTMHLRVVPADQARKSDGDILGEVAHMVRDALQARAVLVSELGAGVEYEAQLARARVDQDGIDADLSAIRVGEYYRRLTEFNILQRVHRAIQSRMEGVQHHDTLNPESEDG